MIKPLLNLLTILIHPLAESIDIKGMTGTLNLLPMHNPITITVTNAKYTTIARRN
jgi:hypothetical protein